MTKEIWHVVVMNYQREILAVTSFTDRNTAENYFNEIYSLPNNPYNIVQLFSGNYECQCSHGIESVVAA